MYVINVKEVIKISDGIFKGLGLEHGDMPLMVLDDLSEMFLVNQMDYIFMDGAVANPIGLRAKDERGHTIRSDLNE